MSGVTVEVEESGQVDTPAVVVVTPESQGESVPAWAVDLIERITKVEQSVTVVAAVTEAVAEQTETANLIAEVALSDASDAMDVAIAAAETADEVAEVAVATAEETGVLPEVMETVATTDVVPDTVPQKAHPLFRSWSDWKGDISAS